MQSNDISALQQKAESGDAEAMLQLAYALNNGNKKGFGASDAEAILAWTEKAAKLGNAQAQYELWDIYSNEDTKNTPYHDLEKAFYWLKEAAQNDHFKAKDDLAFCYLNGTGTSKDYEKAFYWMEQASNDGNTRAKTRLGAAYIEGIGVSVDKERGFSLLKEAASLGDETAKEALRQYSSTSGVGMSDGKHKDWLTTLLLTIFFGHIGVHRFYAGKIGTGILMLLLCWTGISTLWAIIDLIMIVTGKFKDGKGCVIQKNS